MTGSRLGRYKGDPASPRVPEWPKPFPVPLTFPKGTIVNFSEPHAGTGKTRTGKNAGFRCVTFFSEPDVSVFNE